MQSPALAALATLVLACPLLAAAPACAQEMFRVHDRVASDEIEEVTTLIVDGRTIRSFHLDAEDKDIAIAVTVGSAPSHEVGLCGHILVHTSDGGTMRHAFDISALLSDADGRDYEAVASDSYTHFYLVDTTPGRPPARIEPLPGRACSPAVSMR
jgi:hypothetical protein